MEKYLSKGEFYKFGTRVHSARDSTEVLYILGDKLDEVVSKNPQAKALLKMTEDYADSHLKRLLEARS